MLIYMLKNQTSKPQVLIWNVPTTLEQIQISNFVISEFQRHNIDIDVLKSLIWQLVTCVMKLDEKKFVYNLCTMSTFSEWLK